MMKSKAMPNLCILFVLVTTIKCSSMVVYHLKKNRKDYKSEKEYEKVLERYEKKYPDSSIACRKAGEFRASAYYCTKPEEKYQKCYVEKGGLFTKQEKSRIEELKDEIEADGVTNWELLLGMPTLWLLPVGFDYLIHYTLHPEITSEVKLAKFYQEKTQSLTSALEECSQYEPGTSYWKRAKYSKKLSELQERLTQAEKDLAEVEKVENANEILEKFKPVFAGMENVFEIAYIEGVVIGVRKDYVIVKGNAHGVGISDRKLIIYKPQRNFKLYDKTNIKSPYYFLDIEMEIGIDYPIFSPELPRSYKPHEKNYWKYRKAEEYQYLIERRDKLVKEIKSLSESSVFK
ncbi:MAG: hypothetical protein AAF518_07815 [Spirochaetota bacterium]